MENMVAWAVEQSGMTADEVAERMGATKHSMKNWLGGAPMRQDTLRKFCEVTGASADVVLGLKAPDTEEETTLFIGNVNIEEDPGKLVKILRRDAREIEKYRGPDAHKFFHLKRHEEVAASWIEKYIIKNYRMEARHET